MTKKDWISKKIGKIMKEGIRGKKVDVMQASAVAYSMYKRKAKKGKK